MVMREQDDRRETPRLRRMRLYKENQKRFKERGYSIVNAFERGQYIKNETRDGHRLWIQKQATDGSIEVYREYWARGGTRHESNSRISLTEEEAWGLLVILGNRFNLDLER